MIRALLTGLVVMACALPAAGATATPAQTGLDDTAAWMARTIGAAPQSATITVVDPSLLVFAKGAQMTCDGTRSIAINPSSYAAWSSTFDGSGGFDQQAATIVMHELAHGLSPVSCSSDADHDQDEGIVQAAALSLLAPWTAHVSQGKTVITTPCGFYDRSTRRIRRQAVSITGVRDASRPAAKRFIWRLLLADQATRDAMLGAGR